MFTYRGYGLTIQSELELPELIPTDAMPDVVIRFGKVERLPEDVGEQFHSFWSEPEETCLYFQGTGAFLVRSGSEVIIDPLPGVQERVLRLAILGPSLSMILHQRGFLVLHASAAAVNGEAVAFLGSSGDGKSTMAGALHARGHHLIADDLAVVDFTNSEKPGLLPGFPQLKLWPEALATLGDNAEALPEIHPLMEKRAKRLAGGFADLTLPLRCIYVLEEAPDLEIEELTGQDAFVELVRHSHDALLLEATQTTQVHFFQCVNLAQAIPIRRLKRPRSIDLLFEVAQAVEEDLNSSFEAVVGADTHLC